EVYGVCGYHSSLGHIFHYDSESGLRDMGRTFATPPLEIVYSSTEPNTVAISPDGRFLAIGVADRLACVYIYPIKK
ncbi:MAG: hypothetical protein J6S21_00085, partial [Victivallales bacterium]|nr:hypothetical protein [Victivallales bacterium]